jgi:entericidin B
MKKLIALVVAATAMLSLVACNTVQGVGKDVKATGQALEKAAQ